MTAALRAARDPHVQNYIWDALRVSTIPNYWIARWRWRANGRAAAGRLHLGCGKRYVDGWINVDGKPFLVRKDLWLDIRNGLPFGDGSMALIYSSHTFEHLYLSELQRLVAECRRVLRGGGVMRVCVPSLERMIAAYTSSDHAFFDRAACRTAGVYVRRSLGGKLAEMLLHHGAHKLVIDFSLLTELLEDAGFAHACAKSFRTSGAFTPEDLTALEGDDVREHSLFVEAVRQ